MMISACKGDTSKLAAKDARSVDARSPADPGAGAIGDEFDKQMREVVELSEQLIPILNGDEKDCGIVASHLHTAQ
jgi:hypothetical protein